MLLGLALIAVPLLVAVLTAALQIRQLADTGQKIVVEGVTAARASQELFSEISSLERTARLYDVLNDSNLLELYRRQDAPPHRNANPTRAPQSVGHLAKDARRAR